MRHLAAARYFEALGTDEIAAALAGHYLAAHGLATDPDEASALATQARIALVAAAERARALGANDQTVALFEQALGVTTELGERARLELQAGEAAMLANSTEAFERLLGLAIADARVVGDLPALARAAASLGRGRTLQYRVAEAIAGLEAASAETTDLEGDPAVVSLGITLGTAYYFNDDPRRAIELLDRMLETAERLDIAPAVAEALISRGAALSDLGRYYEGVAAIDGGIALADDLDLPLVQLRGLAAKALALVYRDARASLDIQVQAIELAKRLGARISVVRATGNAIEQAWDLGEWAWAERAMASMASEDLEPIDQAMLLLQQTRLAARRGGDTEAFWAAALALIPDQSDDNVRALFLDSEFTMAQALGQWRRMADCCRELGHRSRLNAAHDLRPCRRRDGDAGRGRCGARRPRGVGCDRGARADARRPACGRARGDRRPRRRRGARAGGLQGGDRSRRRLRADRSRPRSWGSRRCARSAPTTTWRQPPEGGPERPSRASAPWRSWTAWTTRSTCTGPAGRDPPARRSGPARRRSAPDDAAIATMSAAPPPGGPRYTRRPMTVTATPAPKSSILLEIEVPADRLDRAVRDATARLSRRTRVAGFRPGKAPRPILERVLGPTAVLDEAVEHLVQDAYRDAIIEQGIVPLTNADVEVVEADEGKPLRFKATVQVRPEVTLGDYGSFNFAPEIETIDDAKVDKVVDELRDQNATLAAVEDRAAKDGDWAVIGFAGTQDGVPFEGGTADRMPLIIGEDRLIPGFEANLVGLKPGDVDRVRHHLPRRLPGGDARRPAGPLRGRPQGAAREDPPRRGRRVRAEHGRLRGPGRAQGGHRRRASAATRSTGPATSSPTRSSSTPSPTRPSSSRTSWSTRRSR